MFGKTVPDISLNAVANLGYADCRFLKPVYPGETLSAAREVIGLRRIRTARPASSMCARRGNRRAAGPELRPLGDGAQAGRTAPVAAAVVPDLPARWRPPCSAGLSGNPSRAVGRRAFREPRRFEDYQAGERIDHVDGMTVEEAEHMLATRLYQNTARVHFNQP